ncbi:MAG: MlaE family lipid ABC transporter permease subunit [Bacteroidetes bacterium]|nr:MlaE family lipid ABC transporter permease subunit [Bacteroidota bacterium]
MKRSKKHTKDSASSQFTFQTEGDIVIITPQNPVVLGSALEFTNAFSALELPKNCTSIILDLSAVEQYDSYLVILISRLRKHATQFSASLEIRGLNPQMKQFVTLLENPLLRTKNRAELPSFLKSYIANVGNVTVDLINDFRFFLEFLGEVFSNIFRLIWNPRSIRWNDFPFYFLRAGVNALPIVVVVGFLMGLIIGYQGAVQLHQFGADIFLADLVGISVTRELAPLMTAIIVAGRSGSAFAAEIGTMKVSEELDALSSMGINIYSFLITPRILAVCLAIPFLVVFSDIAGIIGGLITGMTTLDLTMTGYFTQMQQALTYSHIFSGLFKSFFLGFIIAAVGCLRGLQVHGGAESVGRFTTAAVVTGILLTIIVDAIFTLLYQTLGI